MTTFIEGSGNLLEAEVDALVNTVNTVGVMGKGLALQFKNAYPANFAAYARACKTGQVRLGEMFVFDTSSLTQPRWIINFPTKAHWRSRSRLEDLETGLGDLRRLIQELDISSIAVPPLGCGNGGLAWGDVRPVIEAGLHSLDVDVVLFAPNGAPSAATMVVATNRPALTPSRAALVAAIDRYDSFGFGASLIEVQKLMYFLQEAGEDLALRFEPQLYGPYADGVRHVLRSLEGHHLRGFGDGSKSVRDAEPITVLPGAADEARESLAGNSEIPERLERVLGLVQGYESPYGLELLATVHWATTHDGIDPQDLEAVSTRVRDWSRRKSRMFTVEHIRAALERLADQGWLDALQPA